MTYAAGAGAGAAAGAAIAQAIKASGAIVQVENSVFISLLQNDEEPLVIRAEGKIFFSTTFQYLTPYRGLIFYTKSPAPLELPGESMIIQAKKIWVPY